MTDNIVAMDGGTVEKQDCEPVGSVVSILEKILERARSGEVTSVACVFDTPVGVHYSVGGREIGFDTVGGLELVKKEIIDNITENM